MATQTLSLVQKMEKCFQEYLAFYKIWVTIIRLGGKMDFGGMIKTFEGHDQARKIIKAMNIPTHIFLLLISVSVFGQSKTEINLQEPLLENLEKNVIDLIDKTNLYVNDGVNQELFYYVLKPEERIKGTLILLPPTAQTVEDVINNNLKLAELAYENEVLFIIPSINYNLFLDEITMNFLNTTFKKALEKYAAPEDQIVIGGFSLGGMNAIRYIQSSKENAEITSIHPVAVFGIDPPLDWARIYYSFERTKELNFSAPAVNEATSYLDKLNKQFGGSPKDVPNIYVKHSMYSKTEKDGGNARFLKDTPIRIYADVDIGWHLKERQTDFYDINALDQAAMINHLRISGNENAEFINALGKGYRLNGMRHPHSWSIAEPNELMIWIMNNLD